MKVFRFMSKEEFKKYKNGKLLINTTKHKAKTNSIGFCFFNLEDFEPEFAWKFMKGVVFPDVCAVFEVDKKMLNESYGIYSDPNKSVFELMNFIPKMIKVTEYCCTKYNNKDFKLIRYTKEINIFMQDFEWERCNNDIK